MKILILCALGIVIYLLIGITISLLQHLINIKTQKNPDVYDDIEMIIFVWPLFLIGMILICIIDIPVTFYNKMIDKIDKAYEEEEDKNK